MTARATRLEADPVDGGVLRPITREEIAQAAERWRGLPQPMFLFTTRGAVTIQEAEAIIAVGCWLCAPTPPEQG